MWHAHWSALTNGVTRITDILHASGKTGSVVRSADPTT
jgi:hypothetical protein